MRLLFWIISLSLLLSGAVEAQRRNEPPPLVPTQPPEGEEILEQDDPTDPIEESNAVVEDPNMDPHERLNPELRYLRQKLAERAKAGEDAEGAEIPEENPEPAGEETPGPAAKNKRTLQEALAQQQQKSDEKVGDENKVERTEATAKRGPIFKIPGALAVRHAQSLGYKFSPAGGVGPRNGNHTTASQAQGVVTSEVHGHRMVQLRPHSNWALPQISNTFYMFANSNLGVAPLNKGWKIRGITFNGQNWAWMHRPKNGAQTASFSIMLVAYKNQQPNTTVELRTLTLEGPPGATDWRDAFPSLNAQAAENARAAATSRKVYR